MPDDIKVKYICEGSCHAEITEEQYNAGLTKCATESCTMFGKPFTKVETSAGSED